MAELHPVRQSKSREAIAAYQEILSYKNRTTSEDAAQLRPLLLWAEDQDALRLLLDAGVAHLSHGGCGDAWTRRQAIRLADALGTLLDDAAQDESLLMLSGIPVDGMSEVAE